GPLAFEFITRGSTMKKRQAEKISSGSGVELADGWVFTEETGVANQTASVRRASQWQHSEVVTLFGVGRIAAGALRPTRVDSVEQPWRFVAALPAPGRRVLYF